MDDLFEEVSVLSVESQYPIKITLINERIDKIYFHFNMFVDINPNFLLLIFQKLIIYINS